MVRSETLKSLRHWLVVPRANGVVAEPPVGTTPVDEELRRFDEHMHHVRGLAPKTRSMCLCTVRRLLIEQFADQPVVLSSIKPDDLRSFVARQRAPLPTGTEAAPDAAPLPIHGSLLYIGVETGSSFNTPHQIREVVTRRRRRRKSDWYCQELQRQPHDHYAYRCCRRARRSPKPERMRSNV
jgi:hypothetical protein